jgi:hypothetical protein
LLLGIGVISSGTLYGMARLHFYLKRSLGKGIYQPVVAKFVGSKKLGLLCTAYARSSEYNGENQ